MNRAAVLREASGMGGWCPMSKAEYLYDLASSIAVQKPNAIAVEIGVYAGKSFLPIAAGLLPHGAAFAVDPWSIAATMEGEHLEINRQYWSHENLDFHEAQFRATMERLSIPCEILKCKACEAWKVFRPNSVSLWHEDGNHDEAHALQGFQSAHEKLEPGGFLVVDDVGNKNWPGVDAALPWVEERMTLVHSGEQFSVFQKT